MDKNNLVTVQDLQKMKEEIISEIALITDNQFKKLTISKKANFSFL